MIPTEFEILIALADPAQSNTVGDSSEPCMVTLRALARSKSQFSDPKMPGPRSTSRSEEEEERACWTESGGNTSTQEAYRRQEKKKKDRASRMVIKITPTQGADTLYFLF